VQETALDAKLLLLLKKNEMMNQSRGG
jgi:hypothetical protein